MSIVKKFLNRFSPLFLCLLVILLTGCQLFGGNNNSQLKKAVKLPLDKQVYVAPEIGTSDITTLDPALASDTASINAIQMIFTGLVQVDDKLQVHPQLARSWDVSSDGLSWTFHLRSNL